MSPNIEEIPTNTFDSDVLIIFEPVPLSNFASFCRCAAHAALVLLG
jgi:hypothetical protein